MRTSFVRNSRHTSASHLAWAAGAAIAGASVPQVALGIALSWNNPAGGSAATAGNWSPAQVPTAADTLTFNLNNVFTTTFSGTVQSSTSHTYKRGTVTLNFSATHTASSFVRVGDVSGDVATVTIASGDLIANGGVSIGTASGAAGTLTVDNEGTSLTTVTGGTDVIVGNSGTGTINITDGASVSPADDVIIGSTATGVGHVTVDGAGGLPLPAPSSTLQTTSATGDLVVGDFGDATLDVSGGGRVNVANDMFVARQSGESSTVTVGGAGGILNVGSTISVAGSLFIGQNPSSTNAGAGTFTLNGPGIVDVAGSTRLADTVVGSGTLSVNFGTFTTGSLHIDLPLASFFHNGGTVNINGGTFTAKNGRHEVNASPFTPRMQLQAGATCSLGASVAPFEALVVGRGGNGQFWITDPGTSLSITSGDVLVGLLAGSDASLQVSNDAQMTFPSTRKVAVGVAGVGSFSNRGTITGGTIEVGGGATGDGTFGPSGGSVTTLSGGLYIGGTSAAAAGTGLLTFGGSAALLTLTSTGDNLIVWENGGSCTMNANNTINNAGNVVIRGALTMTDATIHADQFRLDASGDATASGLINARYRVAGPGNVLTLNGDLVAGLASASDGFSNVGTIDVGNHVLTARDSGLANLGTCNVGPNGRIIAVNGFAISVLGGHLTCDGTVEGNVSNSGQITASGDGATFTGLVTGVGTGFSGSLVKFESTGGFTGSGLIDAEIDNRGTITATGDLTIGKSSSNFGVRHDGTIVFNGRRVALLDSNGVSATAAQGNYDMTGGGILVAQPSLNITNAAHTRGIFGFGSVQTGTLRNGALISVGTSTSSSGLRVFGNLINANGATNGAIEVRIASPLLQTLLQVDGTIQLAGELRVTPTNGHVPQPGESHTVIFTPTANGLTGTFSSVTPGWLVQYTSDRVVIQRPCTADVDDGTGSGTPDGGVTIDDLLFYLSLFENGDIRADVDDGSSTGLQDGGVTIDDLLYYLLRFENGC